MSARMKLFELIPAVVREDLMFAGAIAMLGDPERTAEVFHAMLVLYPDLQKDLERVFKEDK